MTKQVVTLDEINSQPEVWQNVLEFLAKSDLPATLQHLHPTNMYWLFVGCGTSFYLAEAAAGSFRSILQVPAQAIPASEILIFPEAALVDSGKQLFPVLISRSGMTSEVIRAARDLQAREIPFLAVTCDGGDLEKLTPYVLRLPVIERSTVMTASFTSMLLVMQYLAARFAENKQLLSAFEKLPAGLRRFLEENEESIKELGEEEFENYVFLGQGALFGIAQECALKVTESSCSYTQSFHTLEFRHGPKSIIVPQVLTGFLISERGYQEEVEVVREMKELGATTLVITNQATSDLREITDYLFVLDLAVPEILRTAAYATVGQLLGSYVGLRKGLNPDSPKNLTRVVMLEA